VQASVVIMLKMMSSLINSPVSQLDGCAISHESDVTSVFSMCEYIWLNRCWKEQAKKLGWEHADMR
jgi:hypothetical protein